MPQGDYREHGVYLMEHRPYLDSKKDRKTTFEILFLTKGLLKG